MLPTHQDCGPTPEPTPARDRRATPRLTASQLVVLQLVARGYSLRQVTTLVSTLLPDGGASGAGTVLAVLRSAAQALGVPTVPAAVAEARRRGVIN